MAVRPMKVWNAATSTWDDVAVSQRGDVVNNTDFAAKGDIIAGTGTSAYDNVAAGSNGQMLMADSSATAGLRYVDPPANRNIAYNGAMQVHQRGTSSTGITTSGYYTADRWQTALSGLGTWTQTVENDAPTGSGLRKSLKMLVTTAKASLDTGNFALLIQKIEGQDVQRIKKGTGSAEQLTFSFWVKANVTGTYIAELEDSDNSRNVSASYTVSQSATWERKTITFSADTTGVFDNDNASSLSLVFWLAAGSNWTSGTLATSWTSPTTANRVAGQTNLAAATNNYWQITGVQLETGPVATPFEFEPYEATLRKCQRYYYVHASGNNQIISLGSYYNSASVYGVVNFPVTMRIKPTYVTTVGTDYYVIWRNGGGDYFNNFTDTTIGDANSTMWGNVSEMSGTAGQVGDVRTSNASSLVAFSAEL